MLESLHSTYSGKKVFLTGHTGFKGSWMLNWLHLLGAEVMGYALQPGNEFDLYNGIQGDTLCTSAIADIRDKEQLTASILQFQPDFIFHLAAQPLVRLSYEQPVDTFAVNAMGTANVLDAVRQLQKKCAVVLITTDKVYENKEWVYPYRENDRLGGYDPYSASKACAEIIVSSYRNSFFNPKDYNEHQKSIASARAGNVIGGGDWAKDRIIPDIIRALQHGNAVNVRNPFSVRPWQHVLEPVGGYLLLGSKMAEDPVRYADSYNFGPVAEDNLTVAQLVQVALAEWGSGSYETPQAGRQPHEAGLLMLDISKAKQHLRWTPRLNSLHAIKLTIQWYKQFSAEPANIAQTTRQQLENFFR